MRLIKRIEAQRRAIDRWLPPPPEKPESRDVSFRSFIEATDPRFQFYWHCEVQIATLQRFLEATVDRIEGRETDYPDYLFVFEPVRHGKSEIVSRKFPAYCLYRFPWLEVGLCSYGADLAHGFSRDAREHYSIAGGDLSKASSAAREWETGSGGKLWAAGVGGPITGKGYHIGIIDDYLKNWDDAASGSTREKQWNWYQSTFLRRKEPGAGTLITATRWHEDDLAGRIIEQERKSSRKKSVHVIHWPAVKEAIAPNHYPDHFTIEPDPREEGDPLCPERYDIEALRDAESDSEFFFSALYQQRPSPSEGAIWKVGDFIPVDELPDGLLADGYDWDLAYTKDDRNSASAYLRSARLEVKNADGDKEIFVYIIDHGYMFLEFPELISEMKKKAGSHFIEAKAAGKSAKQSLDRQGVFAVEVEVPGGGDKEARTHLARPVGASGHIRVYKPVLDKLLYDSKQGVLRFPSGSHDDVNDVLVQAINRHVSFDGFTGSWGSVSL